jgi:hypothetical protein
VPSESVGGAEPPPKTTKKKKPKRKGHRPPTVTLLSSRSSVHRTSPSPLSHWRPHAPIRSSFPSLSPSGWDSQTSRQARSVLPGRPAVAPTDQQVGVDCSTNRLSIRMNIPSTARPDRSASILSGRRQGDRLVHEMESYSGRARRRAAADLPGRRPVVLGSLIMF